jgi:hypothetical protein
MDLAYFESKKQKAYELYSRRDKVYSPYFKENVFLNSNGFHHLQFSDRHERKKEEQVLKFTLLPLGLRIIETATTLQEYRKLLCPVGHKSARDGSRPMKMVEWWGFVAIFVKQGIKVRAVVRRVGDGKFSFWSVMPYSRLPRKGEDRKQKLFTVGIEDD